MKNLLLKIADFYLLILFLLVLTLTALSLNYIQEKAQTEEAHEVQDHKMVDAKYESKQAIVIEEGQNKPQEETKKNVKGKQSTNIKLVNKEQSEDNTQLHWLSRIVNAEAKGESQKGKLAVANVILNRVKSDQFPDTIKNVVFQSGQFQPVSNGSIYNQPNDQAMKAAKQALNGENIVPNALYFYNPATSTSSWIFSREVLTSIGNHNFAR